MRIFSKQSYAVKLTIIGILSFCIFLISSVPAKLLIDPLQEQLPIRFAQTKGSIWNGSASEVLVNGIALGKLQWSINLLPLLLGKLTADIQLQGPTLNATGTVGYQWGNTILLNDMNLETELDWLMKLAALPFSVTGSINAEIERLYLSPKDNQPLPNMDIKATLIWNDAGSDYPEPVKLGNYTLEVNSKQDGQAVLIHLIDGAEALTANGIIEVHSNGNYKADLQLTPKGTLPGSISNALSFIAAREPNGQYAIQQAGRLQDYLDLSEG